MKYFLGKLLHYFTTLQTVMFLSDAAVTSIEPNEVFFSKAFTLIIPKSVKELSRKKSQFWLLSQIMIRS